MKFCVFIFCFTIFGGVSLAKDYSDYKLIRAYPTEAGQVETLYKLMETIDIWSDRIIAGVPVLMSVPNEQISRVQAVFSAKNIKHEIDTRSLQDIISEGSTLKTTRAGQRLDWKDYYRYDDIMEFVAEAAAQMPEDTSITTIGTTFEGRELKVLRFNPKESTKKVWIDGGIHAREWISPAVVTYIINELLFNYEANKEIADKYDWYIIPVQNADGYEYTTTNRLWRKNRNTEQSSLCPGIDLNRNWDFHWMEIGASQNPCTEIYAGPKADSEKETLAVGNYLKNLNSDDSVVIFLTLHSYSQVWLSPWGFTSDLPDDYNDLAKVMKPAVDALVAVHGTDYEYGTSTNVLGAASGASDDWAKGVANIKHSYTIELRDRGQFGFVLPPRQILPTCEETWEGIKVAIEGADADVSK